MSNSIATTTLEAMQALVSIHESLEKLSHFNLESLNPLELSAFQNYYQFVRQKMFSQDETFFPLLSTSESKIVTRNAEETPTNPLSIPEEKSKTKPAKKPSTARNKTTGSKKAKAVGFSPSQDSYDQVKTMFDEI